MIRETRLQQARRLWSNPTVPRELNRANARKWVKAVRALGSRWVYARNQARPVEFYFGGQP